MCVIRTVLIRFDANAVGSRFRLESLGSLFSATLLATLFPTLLKKRRSETVASDPAVSDRYEDTATVPSYWLTGRIWPSQLLGQWTMAA